MSDNSMGYSLSEPAYQNGRKAKEAGKAQSANPYPKNSPNAKDWIRGWQDAKWSSRSQNTHFENGRTRAEKLLNAQRGPFSVKHNQHTGYYEVVDKRGFMVKETRDRATADRWAQEMNTDKEFDKDNL